MPGGSLCELSDKKKGWTFFLNCCVVLEQNKLKKISENRKNMSMKNGQQKSAEKMNGKIASIRRVYKLNFRLKNKPFS